MEAKEEGNLDQQLMRTKQGFLIIKERDGGGKRESLVLRSTHMYTHVYLFIITTSNSVDCNKYNLTGAPI